jgi:dihydroxyacid dehydratase/phosphogluconate dehydratase
MNLDDQHARLQKNLEDVMKNMEDMNMEDLQQNVKTICDGVEMPVDAMKKEELMIAWKL